MKAFDLLFVAFILLLVAFGLLFAATQICHADALVYTSQTPVGGAKGLVIDRPATEPYACGVVWEYSENPAWETGLDISLDYPGVPDLVLAYNPATKSDQLRIRSDTAQVALGARIGHPVMPFQLELDCGNLGGVFVSHHGAFGIYMEDADPVVKRNTISLQNLFGLQTDTADNGTGDYQLYNFQAQSPVYTVQPDNSFSLVAPKEGFYGAAPVTKPQVTGSWSDGSAAKSLLAVLVKLGLAVDNTTP